jgi:hypothetical protein
MRYLVFFMFAFCWVQISMAQDAPNNINASPQSPQATQSGRMASTPVNLFTGIPQISVPIYKYSSPNGLFLSVSLDYIGGGIRVGQEATIVGLGWYLSAGGMITRTVRGMPDDVLQYGYLYAPAIPADIRTDANKYYYDSLDAQQDVFQYNFDGYAGKFFIGKNGQIITVPASKIKITPQFVSSPYAQTTLVSFKIVTENGIKYNFTLPEYTNNQVNNGSLPTGYTGQASGYSGKPYASAWHLEQIISPSNADTIRLHYNHNSDSYQFEFPHVTFVRNSDGVRTVTHKPVGTNNYQYKTLNSIEFPGKIRMDFVYSTSVKYNTTEYALSKIKISDTVFRFGYLMNYVTEENNGARIPALLTSVTPFTSKQQQKPYKFEYDTPLPMPGTPYDTVFNKRDHWGFFNKISNTEQIPQIPPYTWGANRNANSNAITGMLYRYHLPTGGYTEYNYSLNQHLPVTRVPRAISFYPQLGYSGTVSFHQVYTEKHSVTFSWNNSLPRTGAPPFSGSGDLTCTIKSTDGLTTFGSKTISLYEIFYQGLKSWSFTLPNNNYRLEITSSSTNYLSGNPIVEVRWDDKYENTGTDAAISGGVRVTSVTRYAGTGLWASYELYRYVTENGRSSGFLGDVPKYDYPYRELVYNAGPPAVTDYTLISSEPVATAYHSQSYLAGYSRVEVVHGRKDINVGVNENDYTGMEVYEFTDLKDVNSSAFEISFPYTPQEVKSWGLGAPKKIMVYDSAGRLLKKTVNKYKLDTVLYDNANFKSVKLGNTETTYYGLPSSGTATKVKTFIAQDHYPLSGRLLLTETADTIFHADGSANALSKQYEYNSDYNIKRLIEDFDLVRGLKKETRLYYPQDYTVGGTIGMMRDSGITTPVVATETWITGDNNPRLIGGGITSYKQITSGEIKPDVSYIFQNNKPVAQSVIGNFDPSQVNRNNTYFKPQTQALSYDARGIVLEVKDLVSGKSGSVLSDYDGLYQTAKVENAAASDVAYTSFESGSAGNWTIGSTARSTTYAITGKKSYELSNGSLTKSGLNMSQVYLVTLWAKSGAFVQINGLTQSTPIASQNGWHLFSKELTGTTSVSITGTGLIDEVRLHPKDANMMTYTYEPLVGVTSTTDANNTIVYTEYDGLNRIEVLRDKDKNIIKRFSYSDDTTLRILTNPSWVHLANSCGINGSFDSVLVDNNPYSDSYQQQLRIFLRYDPCECGPTPPDYKRVNGVCERAVKVVTSHSWSKVWDAETQTYVWRWRCVFHYRWSDNFTSPTYVTYSVSSQDCYVSNEPD